MSKNHASVGLISLFGSEKAVKEFRSKAWPAEPWVMHDLNKCVADLTALPFLKSLDSMLAAWPHGVQVHLPDVADEASSIDTNVVDAKKLFANGMGLLFNQVQKISPTLDLWLNAIQKDLALPKMTVSRCMVYATPDGKGTAPHFDQNINFVLQLTGIKKWWLAKNTHVIHPSQRYTIGQTIDPELAGYLDQEFPAKLPASKKEYVLKPGSLLFVPQGYWHSTEASGEALSLNFTFSQPSYADLLMAALRSRLLLSPEWRELADVRNETKFDELLLDLTHDLPHWNAHDILGSTEG